jgi:hypothetical protein
MCRFGEQEVDECDFKPEPDHVADQILADESNVIGQRYMLPDIISPPRLSNADGIDELVEEAGTSAENLEERDAFRAGVEGEQFHKICWRMYHSLEEGVGERGVP